MSKTQKPSNIIGNTQGFTLIELLVVIFIIGLISSYAVLSVGARDGKRSLNEETDRLRELLYLAMDEALVTGRPTGLFVTTEGYHFAVATYQGWEPIESPTILKKRDLPRNWRMEVYSNNQATNDTPIHEQSKKTNKQQPIIVFYPSGEVMPFTLSIVDRQQQRLSQLTVTPDGKIELVLQDKD